MDVKSAGIFIDFFKNFLQKNESFTMDFDHVKIKCIKTGVAGGHYEIAV